MGNGLRLKAEAAWMLRALSHIVPSTPMALLCDCSVAFEMHNYVEDDSATVGAAKL